MQEAFLSALSQLMIFNHDSSWYYIDRSDCKTEANRMPSSFVCSKCSNENIPVYDNNDQDVFVLLGDAGRELTGKHASGLVDKYFEANGDLGPDHEMHACPTNFDRHH
ncbi:hypothetical protein F2Q70_00031232 [Brassica cretica]|uniref:Replication factor A C-terminal domain-containing protein n=1 Tax=Brassica cretica TaxID=69181 RepID=A0A8S9FKA2_BRACR|nr:hypothetical protein F2Q70_00031232 [Brassica cretica]KAF3593767.1 hypothetical protein DY000_02024231 [Brassica cretica]